MSQFADQKMSCYAICIGFAVYFTIIAFACLEAFGYNGLPDDVDHGNSANYGAMTLPYLGWSINISDLIKFGQALLVTYCFIMACLMIRSYFYPRTRNNRDEGMPFPELPEKPTIEELIDEIHRLEDEINANLPPRRQQRRGHAP